MQTPVIELLRVSTETQAERLGLPAQRHANRRTAEQYGLRIVETIEIVKSGAEVAETPEMAHVLDVIAAGRARGIVVAAYDRLFRPERWSDMLILQHLQDASAHIYTPTGPIDLSSDLGHMQATLFNLFAAMERRKIRQRMDAGREEKRRRGAHVGFKCSLPYGLDWTKEAGWQYTPEIEIVRELFRRFLAGEHSYTRLSEALGLPRTSVRFILTNPVYTGWRIYDEMRDPSPQARYTGGDRRKMKRPASEVIRVRLPLEPVVTEEQFQLVQGIVERGRIRSARAKAQTHGLFAYRGVLYCARCGALCYAGNKGRKQDGQWKGFYFCKTRLPGGDAPCGARHMSYHLLDEILDEVLTERLTSKAFLEDALSAHLEEAEAQQPKPNTAAIEAHLQKLDTKRERILEGFFDGVITKHERDERLAQIEAERARSASLLEPAPAPSLGIGDVYRAVSVFREWRYLEFDDKRSILEGLMPRIYVENYEPRGVWLPEESLTGGNSGSLLPAAALALPGPAA